MNCGPARGKAGCSCSARTQRMMDRDRRADGGLLNEAVANPQSTPLQVGWLGAGLPMPTRYLTLELCFLDHC